MKITHLIYSFNVGGAETMLVDIANEQAKTEEVCLLIINKIYNNSLLKNIHSGVKIYFINRIESSINPFPIIKLNFLLLKLNADVLHCHNHNIIPFIIPKLRIKSVLTLHCMGIPSKYLNKYHKLFATSESVRKDLVERTQIDSVVVYNGISIASIKSKKDDKLNPIFKVICVGRLDHLIKGQHYAVEALHIHKIKGIRNIQLDLIGSGSSEKYLKELTANYCLTEQVRFLGEKDRDYIYTHLKDYDLLVQPSLTEGFGLAVVEAMAAKVPVLVSDIAGPMEIIENGKCGFYFQAGNAENLAEQFQYIMTLYSATELKQITESAYLRSTANFEIARTTSNYITNY